MQAEIQNLEIRAEEIENLAGINIETLLQFNPIDDLSFKLLRVGGILSLIIFSVKFILESVSRVSSIYILAFLFLIALSIFLLIWGSNRLSYQRIAVFLAPIIPLAALIFAINIPAIAGAITQSLKLSDLALYLTTALIPCLGKILVQQILINRKRSQYTSLIGLKEEVNKYNKIIQNLNVLEQLREAGNPINIDDRDKVIRAIKGMRDDLIRAFRTEKILRENPDFKPEQFNVELAALNAMQVSDQASEYGRILTEALAVGVSVQEQMLKVMKPSP